MKLFPAIDLYDGKVVRLSEGDFAKLTTYDVSPADAAKTYLDAGCGCLHIVDLEGAKTGRPCHLNALEQIAGLGMFVQYGGGLRSVEHVSSALSSGAGRVMTGSLLFKDQDMPLRIYNEFGSAAMPAIDIKGGRVVHSGWLEAAAATPTEALKNLSDIGFSVFLVTDTERDGMLCGTRTELYKPLISDKYEIVAAGGITTENDIKELAEIGIGGVVVGKSLYEGKITLGGALKAADDGGVNR